MSGDNVNLTNYTGLGYQRSKGQVFFDTSRILLHVILNLQLTIIYNEVITCFRTPRLLSSLDIILSNHT